MLRKLPMLILASVLVCAAKAEAVPVTFDLETAPLATGLTSLTFTNGGLTLTIVREGGTAFETRDLAPSGVAGFGNRTLSPFNDTSAFAFLANFSSAINAFSLQYGDFGPSDDDVLVVQAFSGLNGTGALLGSLSVAYPNVSGFLIQTATLSALGIQSVRFIGGSSSFPNSLFYDNITADTGAQVPEPTTLLLLGTAGAFAAFRRRRQ